MITMKQQRTFWHRHFLFQLQVSSATNHKQVHSASLESHVQSTAQTNTYTLISLNSNNFMLENHEYYLKLVVGWFHCVYSRSCDKANHADFHSSTHFALDFLLFYMNIMVHAKTFTDRKFSKQYQIHTNIKLSCKTKFKCNILQQHLTYCSKSKQLFLKTFSSITLLTVTSFQPQPT